MLRWRNLNINIFSFLLAIGPQNTNTMEIFIGLNNTQFQQVLCAVRPLMWSSFKKFESLRLALYMYLLKLKTNYTHVQIAALLNRSESVVDRSIVKIRILVHTALVNLYLYNRSREDLLRNTTPLSRKIYEVNNDTVVLTIDGTYVFTIKSSNFNFQKRSYSMQFKSNLVKFMLFVTTNGLIAAAYGPFEGRENDATIIHKILNERETIFQKLHHGDVDKGFRDALDALRNRGLVVKTPKGTKSNKLTRDDANVSRYATKTRFVVEARNSHIKNKWKYFGSTKIYQSIPRLKMDFQTCAALVNAFCSNVMADEYDWNHIGDLMLATTNEPNILSNIIRHIPDTSFRRVSNLTLFPKLTYKDLKDISLGSYQIRLAKSYCQSHMKRNNNDFFFKCL